jgi:hypothetical protein
LKSAQDKVDAAIAAGQQVLDNCGGSGGSATGASTESNTSTGTGTDNTGTATGAGADTTTGTNTNSGTNGEVFQSLVAVCCILINCSAKRQIGGIACNLARFQTVANLAKSSQAVNKLKAAAAAFVSFSYLFSLLLILSFPLIQ